MKYKKNIWRKIIKSEYLKFLIFAFLLFMGGNILYWSRPHVYSLNDIYEIHGTLNYISKEINPGSKSINKTQRDSLFIIYLNEYSNRFQPSYYPYDKKTFINFTNHGDSITLHIAKQDYKKVGRTNALIRSFSLKVNNTVYYSKEDGFFGFGKGYFELAMIIIPLIAFVLIVRKIFK